MGNGAEERGWYGILRIAIEEGRGDSYALDERHLGRVCLEKEGEGWVEFSLTRHPHIFGRATVGLASDGYIPVEQLYYFDLRTRKLDLRSEEYGEPKVDWDVLISLDPCLDGAGDDVEEEMGNHPKRDDEAAWIAATKKVYDSYDFSGIWDDLCECPSDAVEDFAKEYQRRFYEKLLEDVLKYRFPNRDD